MSNPILIFLIIGKHNNSSIHKFACMARDILSIPITTVASEFVFSVGGRVLDPHRSSLKSDTVEAIISTRDWLFGKKMYSYLFNSC